MESKKKPPKRQRNQLRKYPSFMSVTLADLDNDSLKAGGARPQPGMHTPSDISRPPTQTLRRQGSSPLLGARQLENSTDADYFSLPPLSQAHRVESSSTLRSYYDKTKSPLSISQQTSASSARDMALRKGFPQISSPLSHTVDDSVKAPEPTIITKHTRNISSGSKGSQASKASARSKATTTRRRRPSIIDNPAVYPDTPRGFQAFTPPQALTSSSRPNPISPGPHAASFSRPRWWERKEPKASPPVNGDRKLDYRHPEEAIPSIKINVKKPKPGARNWFDGLDEDEIALDVIQQREVSEFQLPGILAPAVVVHHAPLVTHEDTPQELHPTSPLRKSSFSNKSQRSVPSDRKLNFRLDAPPPRRAYNGKSSPPSMTRSPPSSIGSKSIRSTDSSRGIHAGLDLQIESVLSLSSSEDEGENETSIKPPPRRHRIRPSIERVEHGDEVSSDNAQEMKSVKPRPVVNGHSRRPSLGKPNSAEIVPPVPQIPNRPNVIQNVTRRSSSTKWAQMLEEKLVRTTEAGESAIDSGESDLSGTTKSRRTPSLGQRSRRLHGSKLMKVSSDEERLLEAMREKRISIRQDDFQKGFNKAIQLQGGQDLVDRPKTAGANGCASQSSVYGSRGSMTPPHAGHAYKNSLAGSGISATTDDLALEGALEHAYPFPQVPESLRSSVAFSFPPKPSPGLSFSLSDILPSTPASRNSPMTPPPGHGSLGAYGRGFGTSPSRGVIARNHQGHERKRTVSSSVVMLDGAEQHAQQLDEENEIVGWAMDRW